MCIAANSVLRRLVCCQVEHEDQPLEVLAWRTLLGESFQIRNPIEIGTLTVVNWTRLMALSLNRP